MSQKTIVLFLTKNEEKTVGVEVRKLLELFASHQIGNFEIFLSDDSEDGTRAIAESMGCRIIDGGGQGLGRAFYRAIQEIRKQELGCLIALDCDGQSNIEDVIKFRELVLSGGYDLVTASRFLNRQTSEVKYKYPLINRIGVFFLSGYLSLMAGQRFTDSHGGIRAMSKKAIANMTIYGQWTYVQESIVDCKENNCRMIEIASDWFPRSHGTSRVVGSIPRYIRRVAPYLLFRIFRRLIK